MPAGGDEDLTVVSGAALVFDSTNWDVPQAVTIAAAEDMDMTDGQAQFTISIAGTASRVVVVTEADSDAPDVRLSMETVPVDNISELTGYVTQDIVITTVSDWLSAQLVVMLDEPGGVYQDPLGSANPQSPNPAMFASSSSLEFDTYVSNGVLGESVSVTGAVDLGGPDNSIFDADHISILWYTTNTDDAGELTLARLTLADTANGTWRLVATASPQGGPRVYVPGGIVTNGVLVEMPFNVSETELTVEEGGTAEFTVALWRVPAEPMTVTITRTGGDEDLAVVGGGTLVFDHTNWDTPQTVTIAAAEDMDVGNGQAEFVVSTPGTATQIVIARENDNTEPAVAVDVVPVDNTPPLSGYVTQDIAIATPTDWLDAQLIVTLDAPGGIYQDPLGNTTPQSPDPASFGEAPSLEFDTYVSNGVLAQPVSIAGATGLGGPADAIFDEDHISIAWEGPGPDEIGQLALARVTLADTAHGRWDVLVTAVDAPEVRITGMVENGVLIPLYEHPFRLVVSENELTVAEGETVGVPVSLSRPPIGPVTVTTTWLEGDENLTVVAGGVLVFDSTNWNVPQIATIAAADDVDEGDGWASFQVTTFGTGRRIVRVNEIDNDGLGLHAEVAPVDNTSALTGYVTQDIVITTVSDWLSAQLVVMLDEPGGVYQDPLGSANPQSPNPAMFASSSSLEFDTYVSNGVLGESVSTAGAVDLGGPPDAIFDANHISIVWYTTDTDDMGTLALARLTLADVADGTWQFLTTASPAGGPRIRTGGVVAGGALIEAPFSVSRTDLSVPEGGTAEFTVALSRATTEPMTVTIARTSGDEDLAVVGGATLVFEYANWDTPQTVTIAAAEDADMGNGQAEFAVSAPGTAGRIVLVREEDNDEAAVTVGVVPIDNAPQLTGYVTQDIAIGTPTDWLGAQLIVTLDEPGGIYQDPLGNTDPQSPDPASFGEAPSLEFDTYVSNGVLAQPVSIAGATGLGGPADAIFDEGHIAIAWEGPGPDEIGELALARMTLADTAQGRWDFHVAAADAPEVRITGSVENGVLIPLYEHPFELIVSDTELTVTEGETVELAVSLSRSPINPATVTTMPAGGDEDLTVVSGAALVFDSTNWDVPQAVTIAAAEDEDMAAGQAQFTVSVAGTAGRVVVATEVDNDTPEVRLPMDIISVDNTAELTGYVTQDIMIMTVSDWLSAQLVVTLDQPGGIYQDPLGNANPQSPNTAFFMMAGPLEFDTYVGNGVLGESVSIAGAVDLGGPPNAIFNEDHISILWYTTDTDDIGELALARLTLADTAVGTWQFVATAGSVGGPSIVTGGIVAGGVLLETPIPA